MKIAPDVRNPAAEIRACLATSKACIDRVASMQGATSSRRFGLSPLESHCVRVALWHELGALLLRCVETHSAEVRRHVEREFWCCASLWLGVIADSTIGQCR